MKILNKQVFIMAYTIRLYELSINYVIETSHLFASSDSAIAFINSKYFLTKSIGCAKNYQIETNIRLGRNGVREDATKLQKARCEYKTKLQQQVAETLFYLPCV